MIFVVELKRYMASASIFGVIIGKFNYEKKLCLVILFEVNKGSKVGFYYIILPFGLIIYL